MWQAGCDGTAIESVELVEPVEPVEQRLVGRVERRVGRVDGAGARGRERLDEAEPEAEVAGEGPVEEGRLVPPDDVVGRLGCIGGIRRPAGLEHRGRLRVADDWVAAQPAGSGMRDIGAAGSTRGGSTRGGAAGAGGVTGAGGATREPGGGGISGAGAGIAVIAGDAIGAAVGAGIAIGEVTGAGMAGAGIAGAATTGGGGAKAGAAGAVGVVGGGVVGVVGVVGMVSSGTGSQRCTPAGWWR